MVKYLGLILIVITGFGAGFYYSLRLKNRFEFLSAFKDFLSTLETNMRYNCSDIFTIVKNSAPDMLRNVFINDENPDFQRYWKSCISSVPKRYALKKEDYNLFYEFGRILGTTDIDGQLNHIKLYRELLNNNIDNSLKELKQKSKLSKLLGLFAGLSLALILL
ncbi:MAG: stage III sporulation protein AB [Ruminococcus sp.]|nr:stage III sporulation protein AB [Ruminococcus sp.]